MTPESTDQEKKIEALEAEASAIENSGSHQGFRDASRRNRIEEQLEVLKQTSRRDEPHLADAH